LEDSLLQLESPRDTAKITARWIDLPGDAQLEVFEVEGVEYVRGVPADIVVTFTRFSLPSLSLKRRDSVSRANALCSIHKSYRAIRRPRTNCEQCWAAYNSAHQEESANVHADI